MDQKRTIRFLSNPSLELSCVTIVFDRYDNGSSTKTTERQRRGSSALLPTYQIQGSRHVPNCRKVLKGVGNSWHLLAALYMIMAETFHMPTCIHQTNKQTNKQASKQTNKQTKSSLNVVAD